MIADENGDGDITGNESHRFNKLRSGSEEVSVTELPDGTVRIHGGNTVIVGEFERPPRRVTNPKHHQNSKNPDPKNVDDLYNKSVRANDGTRWVKDDKGVMHRFSEPSNGEVHWNGSTAGSKPIELHNIPAEIIKLLGKPKFR